MSDFTGDFASARAMNWEQFVAAKSRARIAARVGIATPEGVPRPDQIVRLGLPRSRERTRRVILRIVPNGERILLFGSDGAVAWLPNPPRAGSMGYLLVAVDVHHGADALFLASFRRAGRLPATTPSASKRVRLADSEWLGSRAGARDPEGGRTRLQAAMLSNLLRMHFQLEKGGIDPRDVLLPSVSLQIERAITMAESGVAAPAPVSAFASARMPARVVTGAQFTVHVGFAGPDAPPDDLGQRLLIEGLAPDQLVTVKVLRVRNVEVAAACPDSADFEVPTGSASRLASFTMVALAPGPVEVHLRFRQDGATVGLLRLVGEASDDVPATPGRIRDQRPFRTPPPRARVLEISVGTSSDGDLVGVEYDLSLDGEARNWTRSVATDVVLSHLYKDVEAEWTAAVAAHPESPLARDALFALQVRKLGLTLFRDLVPDELQRMMLDDPDRFHGLMIVTNEPRIPWEIACIAGDGGTGPELLFAELGVVRGLSGVIPKASVRIAPARSRYLMPEYGGRLPALPAAGAEERFLVDTLHATPIRPSSVASLTALLRSRDYDLFHFAGHGAVSESEAGGPVILLMDARGRTTVPFTSRDIETALRGRTSDATAESGRVVVLNACHAGALWSETSGFAVAFLRGGIDVFIGSQWSVADDSAAFFASAFYLALLSGASLHQAAATARDAARENGDSGWVAYVVYGDPDASVLFDPLDA